MQDPIAVMLDRQSDFAVRRAASAQARQQHYGQTRWADALWEITLERGYPFWQRRDAIDQLVALDHAEFRSRISRHIKRVPDLETLTYLFDIAVSRNWADLTPAVVSSHAVPWPRVADPNRPERAVLEQLNPGKTVEQIAFDVFTAADKHATLEQQVAAWELLSRLVNRPQLEQLLSTATDPTPLVVDLQAALADLRVLPVNREEVLWLMHLRHPARGSYWQRAKSVVDALTLAQRQGLALRHLAVLVNFEAVLLRNHQPAEQSSLVWADRVVLDVLRSALQDESAMRELFRQADEDHRDTTTEYGGVLDRSNGRFNFRLYEPQLLSHDRKFHPPQEMIDHLYTATAHYHFHAQSYKNQNFAAPGAGDLKLADTLRFNFLVFTFINHDELNVDYHQPGGVVIDLGTLHRPNDLSDQTAQKPAH